MFQGYVEKFLEGRSTFLWRNERVDNKELIESNILITMVHDGDEVIFPFCQEMETASFECFYVVSYFLVSPDRCVSVVAVVAAVVVVVVVVFLIAIHALLTLVFATHCSSTSTAFPPAVPHKCISAVLLQSSAGTASSISACGSSFWPNQF